jgi:hypothetical protein
MAWNLGTPFAGLGGMFKLDPDMTPDQLTARRLMIANMISGGRQADTVGEGLIALAGGVLGGVQNRKLGDIEKTNRQKAEEQFRAAMAGGGWSPWAGGGMTGSAGGDTLASFGGDQQAFVEAMMPHALRVSEQTGLDPRLVIAQAAQETGWGKSAPNNNYFGIKSHGKGGGATMGTTEYVNGRPMQTADSFRQYGGMGQSADDYAAFLQSNPRYRSMLGAHGLDAQLAALGQSGYATDPNYAASVGSIARGINLPSEPMSGGSGMDSLSGGLVMDVMRPATGPAGGPVPPQMPQQMPPQQAPMQPQAPAQMPAQDVMTGGGGIGSMTGGGGDQTAIYQALANPWLTQEQRAALMMMLQQSDPLRQMQLQEAQLRLQQMQEPEAPPAGIQELQWRAAQAGLQPGSTEYQQFILGGGEMPQPAAAPAGIQELEYRAAQAGLQPGSPEWQQFMLTDGKPTQGTQFRIATPEQAAAYGATAGQFGPDGRFYPVDTPKGMTIESDGQGGFRMVQGDAAMTGNVKPFTEGQGKDIGFATRAESALGVLDPVANKLTERGDQALGFVPWGLGRGWQEADYQLAEQAGREFMIAILRKDTGAAVTPSEEQMYGEVYLPRPGDQPGLLERKEKARKVAVVGLKAGMTPAQLLAQAQAIVATGEVPDLPEVNGGGASAADDPLGLFGGN